LLLFAVVSWFALSIIGELIGNQANETAAGQTIGHYVLLIAVVVVPAFLVGWAVLSMRERRRRRSPVASEENPPSTKLFNPPTWHPRPPLCGRDTEVREALKLVRANGAVVVVGPRDTGTSAVGQAVAQWLVDHHDADAGNTNRFDLRSRSTSGPDDAVATAGRVVSAYGIDEPADDTEVVLSRVARELVAKFQSTGGTLLLDNVTSPEQVRWLVREWPTDGPRLVIVGETALSEVADHSTVEIGPMSLEHLRELWHQEMRAGQPRLFTLFTKVTRPFAQQAEELDALLLACFGRPRAVKAFAHEVKRPGSMVTLGDLLTELGKEGPVDGPLERVWQAILANMRENLSPDATRLLAALAELPVTGLTKGAVAAMLAVTDDPVALEQLRIRNLVEEVDGRYRLPQEIRRAIEKTTKEEVRRSVALDAVPGLLRFYAGFAASWVTRLEVDPKGARAWFRMSEPSFRPLYGNTYLDDELLDIVLDDLCAIADAMERWYVRERQPSGLLAMNSGLYGLVQRAGRQDLAALTAIRVAAAHRMSRRFGESATQLDIAVGHADQVRDPRVRSELDSREQVARALLALERESGVPEALDELTRQPVASPTVLINAGALCLANGDVDAALDHLLKAEELAMETGDVGAQAHSTELRGVVLSGQNLIDAVRAWQLARTMYSRIGEDQGEARCLQHLGSAAATDPRAAGQLLRGNPEPLSRREAAQVALTHLESAKALRTGQPNTTLVDHYLDLARTQLAAP
jgi:hypothetical protein